MSPYQALLRDLAEHYLETTPDEGFVRSLVSKVAHFRATSTDEFEIDRRWESLCEKISIKGQGDLANELRKCKAELLQTDELQNPNEQSIVKYDMLSLILALSSGTRSDYARLVKESEASVVDWRDIIAEEPLEGDHWKQLSEDEDLMSTDSEDFVLDQDQLTQNQNRKDEQQRITSAISAPEESIEIQDVNQYDLQRLQQRQYWDSDHGSSDERHITEADAIREILFMLRGYSSVLFKEKSRYDLYAIESQRFEVNENSFVLKHLSRDAFFGVLSELCSYGNVLFSLRTWSKSVIQEIDLSTGAPKFGQTCLAFAVCVATILQDLEMMISDIEVNFCKTDGQPIISLLQLKSKLNIPLRAMKDIHTLIADSPVTDLIKATVMKPRHIATSLIQGLYNDILDAQSACKKYTYDTLVHIFQVTVQPFGRMMDEWISHGSLRADRCQEFFISRNTEAYYNDQSANFWSTGYQFHCVKDDDILYNCPLLSEPFLRRIIFVGKAVLILAKFDIKMNTKRSFDQYLRSVITTPKLVIEKRQHVSEINPPQVCTLNPFLRAGIPLMYRPEKVDEAHAEALDEVPSLFDQSLLRCLDNYIMEPYQQTTSHLNDALRSQGLLNEYLISIDSIYLMLGTELMHVFCESLFTQLDINGPLTEDGVDKLFVDAKLSVEWNLMGSSRAYLKNGLKTGFLAQVKFAYDVPWPINNFIKESALEDYGTITTFLIQLKWAQYLLDRKMIFQQRRNMRLYPMRMKLIWFVNAFWGYVMTTILHTETMHFRKAVDEAVDADEITRLHNDYVSRIVDRCLLGDKTQSVHKAVLKILDMVPELTGLFATAEPPDLKETMDNMEKEFNRSSEFIATTLKIVGRKGGFPWFEALAASLSP